ncbi:MAG: LysR family transcriptional regulator [Kofleriaceae bacterium]|nr:LysR family transcriptional regulator [Myxococcales bacterium]MCB9558796.1 LysR family transcriptional regulator [Kofleriaceae bacterium]MCB9570650.1 LysR family transcriptional regulator [Kofleriaceae bacterium]
MDWHKVAFDWNRARAFLVTAEEGSFSAAARALGLAQPTLGRQVAALEAELGVTLFERVGHALVLTATGLELAEQVRAMGEAATRCALVAAGQAQSLDGVVRIAASEAVSAYVLPPIVDELRARHPGIELELVVSNAASDLRRREADVAIRHVRPQGDDLIARLVRPAGAAYLYGAPRYLARIGRPRTAEALAARAQVVGFDDNDALVRGLRALGLPFGDDRFAVRTASHLVQWELAKHGVGLCMMMAEVGDAEPRVRRALPDAPAVSFTTWLVSHRELQTSRRIRVVFDLLAARLADAPAPAAPVVSAGRRRRSAPRRADTGPTAPRSRAGRPRSARS